MPDPDRASSIFPFSSVSLSVIPDSDRGFRVVGFCLCCVSFVQAQDTGFPMKDVGNDHLEDSRAWLGPHLPPPSVMPDSDRASSIVPFSPVSFRHPRLRSGIQGRSFSPSPFRHPRSSIKNVKDRPRSGIQHRWFLSLLRFIRAGERHWIPDERCRE